MTDTALQKAERQLAQAKARLQALRNREATRSRKMDTRRKVILGGALMDLASRDGAAAAMMDRLLRNLPRDQDRAAFDGWSLGADKAGTAGTASATGTAGATGGGSDGGDAGGTIAALSPSAPPAGSTLGHGNRA